MLIKVLRQTMLAGQVVRFGEVLEASPSDAKLLIGIGKAVAVADKVADLVESTTLALRPRFSACSATTL
jgi:hypothetical protein